MTTEFQPRLSHQAEAAGRVSQQTRDSAMLAEARTAIAAREWHSAAELFTNLLSSPEHAAEANYGLGLLALVQQKPQAAERLFETARAIDPRHANALYQIAKLHEAAGGGDAVSLYEAVLEINPGHVSARDRIGKLSHRESAHAAGHTDGPPEPAPATPTAPPYRHVMPPPAPANHEVAEPDMFSAGPGACDYDALGVEQFLRQDASALSRQAIELIDRVQFRVRGLSWTAQLDAMLKRGLGLSGLALLFVGALLVSWVPPGYATTSTWVGYAVVGLVLVAGAAVCEVMEWRRRHVDDPAKKAIGEVVKWVAPGLGTAAAGILVGVGRRTHHLAPTGSRALVLAAGVAGAVWTVAALFDVLRARTTTIRIANARIYQEAGILAKHSRVVDLWLVQQIEIDRSAVNRLTQDGTLIFHLVGNKTYTLTGLCRGPELEQAFKKLQDLRFFLRSNPVVKGIVQ